MNLPEIERFDKTWPEFTWPSEALAPITGMESVRIATTESERLEIYQLRYRVYVEQQRKPYPADHGRRILSDEFDQSAALLYARNLGQTEIVATVRINSGADNKTLDALKREFQLDAFLTRAAPEQLHLYSRLVTIDESVISRPLRKLLERAYVLQRQCNIRFIFCRTNARLVPFFQKLGFASYGATWDDPVVGLQICMVSLPPDLKHLQEVGSPIRHVAAQFQSDRADRLWLERTFPNATLSAPIVSKANSING